MHQCVTDALVFIINLLLRFLSFDTLLNFIFVNYVLFL